MKRVYRTRINNKSKLLNKYINIHVYCNNIEFLIMQIKISRFNNIVIMLKYSIKPLKDIIKILNNTTYTVRNEI